MLGMLLLAFVTFRGRHLVRQVLRRPRSPVLPRSPRPDVFANGGKSVVALAGGGTLRERLEKCLELLGGVDRLDLAGKTVLVKPNVVAGRPFPTTTNPDLIAALCEVLQRFGAAEVWVGDMSALMTLPTRRNLEQSGILEAARKAGARLLAFEESRWVPVKIPNGRFLREVYVSEWIFRADRVINVPVIKTHRNATFSGCLKNFVGATHGRHRPYLVDPGSWEEVVAELNLAYRPDLNILDGTRVMISGGPWEGETAETGVLLASGDRVAADAVAVALLKTYGASQRLDRRSTWEQLQIRRSGELGIGASSPERMELRTILLEADPDLERRIHQLQRLLTPGAEDQSSSFARPSRPVGTAPS